MKGRRRMIILNGKNRIGILIVYGMLLLTGCGESNAQGNVVSETEQEVVFATETENMTEVYEQSEDEAFLKATEEDKNKVQEEQTDIIYEQDWEKIVTSDMNEFDVAYKSINVEYPQFPQLKGYPTEINTLLEEDVKYHCNDIYNISCPYNLKGKVTYLDENYISVLYQGTGYPATSAWDFAWATTVDMKTCTIVGIEDVVELNGVLEKLEQIEFEQVRGIDLDYYEELKPGYEESPTNWKEKYENFSMGSYDENHYYDFYLKEDKIGILLGVEEAIGAYIIVEIDR